MAKSEEVNFKPSIHVLRMESTFVVGWCGICMVQIIPLAIIIYQMPLSNVFRRRLVEAQSLVGYVFQEMSQYNTRHSACQLISDVLELCYRRYLNPYDSLANK